MEIFLQENYQKKRIQTNQNFLSLSRFNSASFTLLLDAISPSPTLLQPSLLRCQKPHTSKTFQGKKKHLTTTPINQPTDQSLKKTQK